MSSYDRVVQYITPSSVVKFVPFGTPIGGAGNEVVSADVKPVPLPTDEDPGEWLSLGRVQASTPSTDMKSQQLEGAADNGQWVFDEIQVSQYRRIKFTTRMMSPEVLQSIFGLATVPEPGESVQPFVSNGIINGWIYYRIGNGLQEGKKLGVLVCPGRLRVVTPPNMTSDVITVEWEFLALPNEISEFTTGEQ